MNKLFCVFIFSIIFSGSTQCFSEGEDSEFSEINSFHNIARLIKLTTTALSLENMSWELKPKVMEKRIARLPEQEEKYREEIEMAIRTDEYERPSEKWSHLSEAEIEWTASTLGFLLNLYSTMFIFPNKLPEGYTSPRVSEFKEEYDIRKNNLFWCTECSRDFTTERRLALIINFVYEIGKIFPDKNQKLVVTSFASGGLKQEFLTIATLLYLGYTNIQFNIIDIIYPHKAFFPDFGTAAEGKTSEELDVKSTDQLDDLQILSAKEVSKYPKEIKLKFSIYDDTYEYIFECEANPLLKSHAIMAVDIDAPMISSETKP
jgi:hypothetical protein